MIKRYREFILENLNADQPLWEIIVYLSTVKNDKVATILLHTAALYSDDNEINYISLSKEANMIRFLPKNRRPYNSPPRELMLDPTKSTSIRIGRAAKQITDILMSKYSKFQYSGPAMMVNHYNPFITFSNDTEVLYIPLARHNMNPTDCVLKLDYNGGVYEVSPAAISTSNGKTTVSLGRYLQKADFNELTKLMPTPTFGKIDGVPIKIDIDIKNDISVTASDIEKFTNEFISAVKMSRADEDSVMEIVNGPDISYWYNYENYQTTMGKLGSSCMSSPEAANYYMDIYTKNPDKVSLLILKNKENKLIGRALLWKLDDGKTFMDRIYTSSDSDDNLFVNYAIKNEFIYRNTSAGSYSYFINGQKLDSHNMEVTLSKYEFQQYPYLDTFIYLCTGGVLRNYRKDLLKTLTSTEGNWVEYDEYEDEDDNDEYDLIYR